MLGPVPSTFTQLIMYNNRSSEMNLSLIVVVVVAVTISLVTLEAEGISQAEKCLMFLL